MNIAFFGSSLVSAYWNGAATYYRGIIKSLNKLGHRVTFYEPDAYNRQQHRDIPDPDWARVVVYPPHEMDVQVCLERAATADVVIKASGVGIFDDLLEREVLQLQDETRIVLFWDVDAPATLDRVLSDRSDPFRELIPRYDCILTYGGGDPVVEAYRELGARSCIPVYNGFDPETHHPARKRKAFKSDLSFLGNRLPDREERVDEFFLKPAAMMPGQSFILGGNGWGDKSMSDNIRYLGHVYTTDHNAFNCSSKAVLNICRESMARYGFSPATRVFEAAGAGACMITDSFAGLEMFLEPGREILTAGNGEEVANILGGLDQEKAHTIGRAAMKRVNREHTYDQRARQVDWLLRGSDSRRVA